jgi:hypothetical protein
MTNISSPISQRRWLALLIAIVLATTTGADSDQDAPSGDSSDGTDDDQDDGDTSDGMTDDDTSDDMTDDDTSDDMTGDDMTGDPGSSYCQLSLRQDQIDAEFQFLTATPQEIEAYFLDNRDSLAQALSIAPAEIRGDLQTLLDAFDNQFLPVLSAANWDFLAAGDELSAISEDPDLEAATDRLDIYSENVCESGDDFVQTPDDAEEFLQTPDGIETLLQSEFGRQALIQGFTEDGEITTEQAECLVDNLDAGLLAALSLGQSGDGAIGELLSVFDTCGISPDQLG